MKKRKEGRREGGREKKERNKEMYPFNSYIHKDIQAQKLLPVVIWDDQ